MTFEANANLNATKKNRMRKSDKAKEKEKAKDDKVQESNANFTEAHMESLIANDPDWGLSYTYHVLARDKDIIAPSAHADTIHL
ncbi:hypothetical protein MN608_08621 [Microdochium nivale]|nr:hypothetical protein MN608_08621 [Microdochium nivale]